MPTRKVLFIGMSTSFSYFLTDDAHALGRCQSDIQVSQWHINSSSWPLKGSDVFKNIDGFMERGAGFSQADTMETSLSVWTATANVLLVEAVQLRNQKWVLRTTLRIQHV